MYKPLKLDFLSQNKMMCCVQTAGFKKRKQLIEILLKVISSMRPII